MKHTRIRGMLSTINKSHGSTGKLCEDSIINKLLDGGFHLEKSPRVVDDDFSNSKTYDMDIFLPNRRIFCEVKSSVSDASLAKIQVQCKSFRQKYGNSIRIFIFVLRQPYNKRKHIEDLKSLKYIDAVFCEFNDENRTTAEIINENSKIIYNNFINYLKSKPKTIKIMKRPKNPTPIVADETVEFFPLVQHLIDNGTSEDIRRACLIYNKMNDSEVSDTESTASTVVGRPRNSKRKSKRNKNKAATEWTKRKNRIVTKIPEYKGDPTSDLNLISATNLFGWSKGDELYSKRNDLDRDMLLKKSCFYKKTLGNVKLYVNIPKYEAVMDALEDEKYIPLEHKYVR